MTRWLSCVLFGLLLLGAAPAWAQPSIADRRTGIEERSSGLDPATLSRYLSAVESLTTELEWETRGDSRREFNASRIQVNASWARGGDGSPVLTGATIRPVAGGRLHFGGHKLNKVRIDSKGVIHIDRKGIDTKIYKITQKANGDLVLDLPWYHGGDRTIKASEIGGVRISQWPPTLEQLVAIFAGAGGGGGGETQHEGRFRWRVRGNSSPTRFNLPGGAVTAGTTFDIRGSGVLQPDGSFRTIGGDNQATVELNVGRQRYQRDNRTLTAELTRGQLRYEGRYGLVVPTEAGSTVLEVDGTLRYSAEGGMRFDLPSGTRLHASGVTLSGEGRISGAVGPAGVSTALRDGTYRIEANGPVGLTGLRAGALSLDDLELQGGLSSSGTVEELSERRFAMRGGWAGSVEVRGRRGAVGALLGEEDGGLNGTLRAGSRVDVDLNDVSLEARFPLDQEDGGITTRASGRVHGALGLDNASVSGSFGRVEAPSLSTSFDLEVEAGTPSEGSPDWLHNARGRVGATLDEGGRLDWGLGLPGEPVLPGADRSRNHRVRPGETLHEIARHYEVPVAAIRAANGLDSESLAGRDTLRIPGTGPIAEAPSEARGHWRADIAPGSGVELELSEARIGPDGVVVAGHASSRLELKGSDLRSGSLEARILGAARASLARTAFRLAPGPDGRYRVRIDEVRVPVRVELDPRTRVDIASPGRETEIVLDREGSYAEFEVSVSSDSEGRLRVDSLQEVDLLVHGTGPARFAGEAASLPGAKSIRYTGRLEFVERGLDFYGDITVTVRGSETEPAVRIRW